MSKQQVSEILKWLQANYPDIVLTLSEVQTLVDIERTAEPGTYGAWAENIPQKMIDEMDKELKNSEEYLNYQNLVNLFTQKIELRLKNKSN
ncbi:hypothetical protein [Maribellus mangrovi]|uniref:hypothetical protein n=1 Tax=Maribellus mangrovi TaxID=3133146 RepID=UPI0030EC973E